MLVLATLILHAMNFFVNHQRDSLASYVGHSHLLTYFALARGESIGRFKHECLKKMVLPCGAKPLENTNEGDDNDDKDDSDDDKMET